MRRSALVLLLVATAAHAEVSTSTVQVMEQAFDSEGEQAACARARASAEDKAVAELLDKARSLKGFHRTLDEYRFAGFDRERLNADLGQAIVIEGQWTEVNRVWSGRSCLVQLLAEVHLDDALGALAEALPERGPDSTAPAPRVEAPWWQQVPGISQFRSASHVSRALAELAMVKTLLAEFWLSEGRWPYGMSELGLDPATFRRSEVIERVNIEQDGVIHAVLKGELGGEWLALTPSDGPMGSLQWRCTVSVSVPVSACEGP